MGALLSPNALSISPLDWANPTKRDIFLDRLWGYLHVIEVLDSTRIFWSPELAAALFTNPTPPWLVDDSWKNQLVPALYPAIVKHATELSPGNCSCTVSPPGSCTSACSPGVNAAFLKLVHESTSSPETSDLLGSTDDIPGNQRTVQFICALHRIDVTERLCRDRSDYAAILDLPRLCWPTHPDCQNYERLKLGAQLTAEVELRWPTGKELPTFGCSPRFLDDLAEQTAYRPKILKALALRLAIGLTAATTNSTLRDEDIPHTKSGLRGERRFRATKALRFHYLPVENDSIRLVRFFGPGKHDDGLR